jgi:DNA repair protein RadA/Sms
MARARSVFRCSACGWETPAFAGRCGQCRSWNTLEERAVAAGAPARRTGAPGGRVVRLDAIGAEAEARMPTQIPEFDRVLGGGVVPGSVVLLGGEPGIGKSTLALQAAAALAGRGVCVAYVCGEESPRQVRQRAVRLGLERAALVLVPETDVETALAAVASEGAALAVVDSAQAMRIAGLETRAGGPAQLAEVGARLASWAKENEIALLVTGHVTKSGDIAGPRLLEHLVDAVLYFEGAESGTLRVLRAEKNRFGATDEVGVFEMTGSGLASVENPGSAFLEADGKPASGCAVTAVVEGSRPIAVEVQALAVPSFLASPRRIASGIEASRVHLLLAVLARRAGVNAGSLDVVATVTGGLRLRDPGTDLAVLAALASAIRDRPIAPGTAFLGEVALSGRIRPAQSARRRLEELARLGFTRCFAAADAGAGIGVDVVVVRTVRDLLERALAPGG